MKVLGRLYVPPEIVGASCPVSGCWPSCENPRRRRPPSWQIETDRRTDGQTEGQTDGRNCRS